MPALKLDLLFILDATGSQGPYISEVKGSIIDIVREITKSDKVDDLKIGFIAFRDHPPQASMFVTREWDFTSDVSQMYKILNSIRCSEGGDIPEAVTAALAKALEMGWREDARKITVLISDAPPHGIGTYGDAFPDGVPEEGDPLVIARKMLKMGITLHFIACEPGLSSTNNTVEFYRGLTRITSGVVISLLARDQLAKCIIGSALETLALESLLEEHEAQLDQQSSLGQTATQLVQYFYSLLSFRKKQVPQLHVESIYTWTPERVHNVKVWAASTTIAEARERLKPVTGKPLRPEVAYVYRPNDYVTITFKNTEEKDSIRIGLYDAQGNLRLSPDGKTPLLRGNILPNMKIPKKIEAHEKQLLKLRLGKYEKPHEYTFTRREDYDVAQKFQALPMPPKNGPLP